MQKENQLKSCCKNSLSSPNVSIGDLQRTRRFVMKQQTTCVEDSRLRPSGMTGLFYHGNNAFTLIELLVVVLIIGILAAVAVPQYQKAVWKSKNTQLKTIIKAVQQAEYTYYLANGTYATNFEELAIDLPLTPLSYSSCGLALPGTHAMYQGKDFEIALNGFNNTYIEITALWTSGPYRCSGFQLLPSEEFYCLVLSGTRTFCEKLEKGQYKKMQGAYAAYTMP